MRNECVVCVCVLWLALKSRTTSTHTHTRTHSTHTGRQHTRGTWQVAGNTRRHWPLSAFIILTRMLHAVYPRLPPSQLSPFLTLSSGSHDTLQAAAATSLSSSSSQLPFHIKQVAKMRPLSLSALALFICHKEHLLI